MWEKPKAEIEANLPGVVKAYGVRGVSAVVLILAAGALCLHAVNDNFPGGPDDDENILKKAKEALARLRKGGK